MAEILCDLSSQSVEKAIERNFEDVYSMMRAVPGVAYEECHGCVRVSVGVPHPIGNLVLRSRLSPDSIDEAIESTLSFFRNRNMPVSWVLSASSKPDGLRSHLQAHGLTRETTLPGMAIDLDTISEAAQPVGVDVREVHNKESLSHWIDVTTVSFGLPRELIEIFARASVAPGFGDNAAMRNFVAYRSGAPIGASSLFVSAGVAGIYCVGVLEQARRQGVGAAVTTAPLHVARALGYRVGILLTSPMGRRVYERLGFQPCGGIDHCF